MHFLAVLSFVSLTTISKQEANQRGLRSPFVMQILFLMVPIVRTGLVNRMTTYLFSLKVLKILLLVVAKGVNSV